MSKHPVSKSFPSLKTAILVVPPPTSRLTTVESSSSEILSAPAPFAEIIDSKS